MRFLAIVFMVILTTGMCFGETANGRSAREWLSAFPGQVSVVASDEGTVLRLQGPAALNLMGLPEDEPVYKISPKQAEVFYVDSFKCVRKAKPSLKQLIEINNKIARQGKTMEQVTAHYNVCEAQVDVHFSSP